MLTLKRKEGQSIIIGEDIKIVIQEVIPLADGRYDVKVGCEAPQYITIDREEVRERRLKNIRDIERLKHGNSK